MLIGFGDRTIAMMTAYCEASNQTPVARRGVIHTMFNRLLINPKQFGMTIAAVCLAWMQFSEWNGDRQDRRNLIRAAVATADDPVVVDCGKAYDDIQAGREPDPTDGATHYHDTSIAPPSWTVGATRTRQIDKLIFYKNVK